MSTSDPRLLSTIVGRVVSMTNQHNGTAGRTVGARA